MKPKWFRVVILTSKVGLFFWRRQQRRSPTEPIVERFPNRNRKET